MLQTAALLFWATCALLLQLQSALTRVAQSVVIWESGSKAQNIARNKFGEIEQLFFFLETLFYCKIRKNIF